MTMTKVKSKLLLNRQRRQKWTANWEEWELRRHRRNGTQSIAYVRIER